MREVQKNKINVHRFFRELFGRETTRFDLLAILIGSVSLAGIILFFKWNADFSVIKKTVKKRCSQFSHLTLVVASLLTLRQGQITIMLNH